MQRTTTHAYYYGATELFKPLFRSHERVPFESDRGSAAVDEWSGDDVGAIAVDSAWRELSHGAAVFQHELGLESNPLAHHSPPPAGSRGGDVASGR